MASVLVFFTVIALSSALDINIHQCRHVSGTLLCGWEGRDIYKPDRPLYGVREVVFSRFLTGSTLDLRTNAPDLAVVRIESGDVQCNEILVHRSVMVYKNDRECSLGTATTTTTMDEVSTQFTGDASAEGNDKTTVKLQVDAGKGNLPIISITWEALDRVEMLLIVILGLTVFLLVRCMKPKRKYTRKQKQRQSQETQTDVTGTQEMGTTRRSNRRPRARN